MIGGGTLGPQAASAVRHVAAQNGVWSLGNFGGMPPKSAMMYHQGGNSNDPNIQQQQLSSDGSVLQNMIDEPDYRFVFNSCTVGMVSNMLCLQLSTVTTSNLILFICFQKSGHCFNGWGIY